MAAAILLALAVLAPFVWWRAWFFWRNPARCPPAGDALLCAADGRVVYVKRVRAGEVPVSVKGQRAMRLLECAPVLDAARGDGVLIGTYMSVFSVHQNRIPVSGEVVLRVHRPAVRNVSMARMMVYTLLGREPYDEDCRHLIQNERLTIGIRTPGGVVLVTQIADAWIRRIRADVGVGQPVERGARYGAILLGSQVDVFVPDSLGFRVVVRPGQAVRAGETPLAVRAVGP